MRQRIGGLGIVLVLGVGAFPAPAYSQEDAKPQAPSPASSAPTADPPSGSSSLFNEIREAILRQDANPEVRRTSARILVRAESAEANELIVELLRFRDDPQVRLVVCGVLGNHLQENHRDLAPVFVDPLIELLSANDERLRSTAARTLSHSLQEAVARELGELARNREAAPFARLAAIDALSPNLDDSVVISELMSLLEGEPDDLSRRVVTVLESATGERFGESLSDWRAWWREKAPIWTAYRLESYRSRSQSLERELSELSEKSAGTKETLTARLGSIQREFFRSLTPEQQEERLAQWLIDPVLEVRLTALTIITARIGDAGYRPEGGVLDALLHILSEEVSIELRREALRVVENLKDPAVVQAVVSALEDESDPAARRTFLRALGKLGSADAIPVLVGEIASPAAAGECVREAAIALGLLAGRTGGSELIESAVEPLKWRYASIPDEDVAYRAAVLLGMSGVAHPSFLSELLDAVELDEADLLRPAVSGLSAIGDPSRLPRFRTLTGHSDSGVRLAAIEAVGRFGKDDADAECLLPRLNPKVETHRAARETAWTAFCKVMSARPVGEQLAWTERLRELPGLELAFLVELEKSLAAHNGDPRGLEIVRDRLATILLEAGQYAEAVICLRGLYASLSSRSDGGAGECGLRLLDAVLNSGVHQNVGELVGQLAKAAPDEASKANIVERIAAYADAESIRANKDVIGTLLTQFKAVPSDALGQAWRELLARMEQRLGPPEQTPPAGETPAP